MILSADPTTLSARPAVVAAERGALHQIVVVGGGAAGLELATMLGNRLGKRKRAAITLIDRTRTHIWKPKLHEIAAGSMDMNVHSVDYLAQAHWHHFSYRIGEMTSIDRRRKEVSVAAFVDAEGREVTPARSFRYDTLVISVGSQSNDFGTPGVSEFAMKLETPADAERFNHRLVNACIRAHAQTGLIEPEQLHVAIIGAGATGVELAAELHRTTREVVAFGLDRIDPDRDIRLNLIEAADRVLPALPERLSKATHDLLTRLGVHVHTSARVSEILDGGSVWPTVAPSVQRWWSGRRVSRRPSSSAGSTASKPTASTSSSCARRCRPRSTTTFTPLATVLRVPGRRSVAGYRRAPRRRISRRRTWWASSSGCLPAKR